MEGKSLATRATIQAQRQLLALPKATEHFGRCWKKPGGESSLEPQGIQTHFLVRLKSVHIDSITDLGS